MGRRRHGRLRRIMAPIREVWSYNLERELAVLDGYLNRFSIVSIDTEFPGFIRGTPWGATEEQLYDDFRFNVNQTKLIQLGLTVSDRSGKIGFTWEFNFCDFDAENDVHNVASVSFLKENGMDFEKLKKDGIAMKDFSLKVYPIFGKPRVSRWVTFHGLYDIGYLLKAVAVANLPESIEDFADLVEHTLGNVSDLKHMAQYCKGLEEGKLGLEKLAKLLCVDRVGEKHHAGSDSLVTASLYGKMKQLFEVDSDVWEGYLYGLRNKLHSTDMEIELSQTLTFGQFCFRVPVYHQPYFHVFY